MLDWNQYIFSDQPFEAKARRVFEYQYKNNSIYSRFCDAISPLYKEEVLKQDQGDNGVDADKIPLLPIRAFKDAELNCKPDQKSDLIFKSSGTGTMKRSRHFIADSELYRQSLLKGFRHFYDLDKAVILAYTPGYAENSHSSLIWMIRELIKQDKSGQSRFLPLNKPLRKSEVDKIKQSGKQLIIFGAAFGLLDLIEMKQLTLPSSSIVIETGGMKTHRREMNRKEMHRKLARGFGLANNHIHSEYGMAELLSQSYATGGKWFRTVPWMKVSIRNPDNPQETLPAFSEGLIGVIDLANIYSCSFILTGDKGMMDKDGRFQVLGRWNPKDLRGCNFLIDED